MYKDKQIYTATETRFLGLFINNIPSWKTHIECIMSKLSSAYYAMQSVKLHVSLNTLKITLRCRHHPQHYANTTTPK
jgi:hypothetical protein